MHIEYYSGHLCSSVVQNSIKIGSWYISYTTINTNLCTSYEQWYRWWPELSSLSVYLVQNRGWIHKTIIRRWILRAISSYLPTWRVKQTYMMLDNIDERIKPSTEYIDTLSSGNRVLLIETVLAKEQEAEREYTCVSLSLPLLL